MKIRSNRGTMAISMATIGLGAIWPGVAAPKDDTDKWYLGGDVGVALQQNVGGIKLAGTSIPGNAEFDPGIRLDVTALYNVTPSWALEYDTGFSYNTVSKIAGVSASNADLWQVPLLVNGIYQHSFGTKWQGYGGVGIGGVVSVFNSPQSIAGVAVPGGSDEDIQFGYQALLGLRYCISSSWECDLGYKFLGTLNHRWNIGGVSVDTDPTFSHSIVLSLTHKF